MNPEILQFIRDVLDPTRGQGMWGMGADALRAIQRDPVGELSGYNTWKSGRERVAGGHPVTGTLLQALGLAGAIPAAGATDDVAKALLRNRATSGATRRAADVGAIEQGDAVRQLLGHLGERRRSGSTAPAPFGRRASDMEAIDLLREAERDARAAGPQQRMTPYTDVDPVTQLSRMLEAMGRSGSRR